MNFPFLDFESSFFTNEELLFLAGASGGGVEHTIINNPATFTTDLAKPLRRLVIPLTPVQSGSGDPSPSNIRPITGWTGLNINRTGKNMFHINGTDMVSDGWNRYFPNSFTKAGTYRFSCGKQWGGTGQKGGVIGFKDSPSNSASRIGEMLGSYSFGNTSYSFTATITEEQAKAKYMYFGCSSENAPASTFTDAEFQLELGTTATAYEPYSGTTVPVSWQTEAGTVYGGTLDALTGILTVTHTLIDLTDVTYWEKSVAYPGGFYSYTEHLGIKERKDFICSHAKTATTLAQYVQGTCYCDGSINIRIMPEGSELTDWETYLQAQSQNGTPVCIAAELREPQTIQLDPVTLSTLKGYNAIWTDTNGDNTIVYLKKT